MTSAFEFPPSRANQLSSKKQQRLGRRAAFLRRQQLVAARAQRKAEKAVTALSASLRTRATVERGGGNSPKTDPEQDRQLAQQAAILREKIQARVRDLIGKTCRFEISGAFAPGDRVTHLKFGPGTVTEIEGNKLTIAFDNAGEKRIIDSFVVRE